MIEFFLTFCGFCYQPNTVFVNSKAVIAAVLCDQEPGGVSYGDGTSIWTIYAPDRHDPRRVIIQYKDIETKQARQLVIECGAGAAG